MQSHLSMQNCIFKSLEHVEPSFYAHLCMIDLIFFVSACNRVKCKKEFYVCVCVSHVSFHCFEARAASASVSSNPRG